MKPMFTFLLLISILTWATSCLNYATLQTPKVLEDSEKMFGAGLTFGTSDANEISFIPSIYSRFAAFKNTDIGINLVGLPGVGAVGADIKYPLVEIDSSFYVSLDFGISYSAGDWGSTIGYYPAIFVGTERFFGGGKMIIADFDVDFFGKNEGTGSLPEFFIGTSIGNDFRLIPILNILVSPEFDDAIFLIDLGLEYKF